MQFYRPFVEDKMSTQLNNITIKILFSPLSDIVEIYQEFIKKITRVPSV
ncbi:hypothetical protein clem_03025 [Legionella clemsonensis]|uniref:Uncharacterized protein n=1 Tax=Legionella clemsonensis TaxID=1867846 RepID=A0A222NZX4_9GAMM|nr:hypothetical protein clem_03025 [Legionella clemsonensis]